MKTAEAIQYKAYTIEEDFRDPYSNEPEFMFYPTADGIQHDADYDGVSHFYSGNCRWADSIEGAKGIIDDLDPVTNREWKIN